MFEPASEEEECKRPLDTSVLDDDGRRMLRQGAEHLAVGFELAICLLIGYFGGRWLDKTFDTSPFLTIFGGVVGVGAAVKVILRIIKRTDLDKL